MLPKRAGADNGAKGKKCKYKSLSMLEKVELLKKLEKGTCVKTLSTMASDHLLCMAYRNRSRFAVSLYETIKTYFESIDNGFISGFRFCCLLFYL